MLKGRQVKGWSRFACLGCCWVTLSGLSPSDPPPRLDYKLAGFEDSDPALPLLPPDLQAGPAASAAKPPGKRWRLLVDSSILADSNVTNSTDDRSIPMFQGDVVLPVPLDPALRAHSGTGVGVAVAGGVELPIGSGLSLAADAEGYSLDYEGGSNDDISLLLAAGPIVRWSGGEASLQILAFDRWYGGLSASAGFGLRGRYKQEVAPGQRVVLAVDARVFESGYGEEFGGRQGSLYLSYDSVMNPVTTGSVGAFVRRDRLDGLAYSSFEFGAYAGVSRYLGSALTGSVSGGISSILFDAPIAFLSPDPREDLRLYATAALTTREAIGWGVYPSISYTYNWTSSSISFFEARRHRLRLGLSRSF
jgi:hypothetical protein